MRSHTPQQDLISPLPGWLALACVLLCAMLAAGCSTLPRLNLDPAYSASRPPNFASATRVFTDEQNKAILERLKRQAGDTDILTLRKAGIRVVEFNPVNPLSVLPGGGLNNRDHRKLIVVDGSTAFVGGINISNVYSSGSHVDIGSRASGSSRSTGSWRDTHLQIDGPVVTEFQKIFLQTWEKQKGEPLTDIYLPALTPKGAHIVRANASTPDQQRNELYLTLLSAVTFAERNIHLTNTYFAPDPQFIEALRAAAGRGVDVRLILPCTTDSWLAFHAGRSHYADLLAAGVKIYERRGPLLHAKISTIDGVWSSVGTTNLDWRSFLHNDEVDAAIVGREFARQMEAMFARDLAQSNQITAEQWERRFLSLRLKEWSARMFEYML